MARDPLKAFEPQVAGWFTRAFAAPTEAQAQAWPAIATGEHVLISAPTGSGKTLAAFLWGLNKFVAEPPADVAEGASLRAPGRRNPYPSEISAAGKHVIVIGGGDTGADCVGNSHREGAASVTQIELLGEPPATRPDDLTPWPRWPVKYRRSYAIKEGGEQDFSISTTKLTGNGHVEQIHWMRNTGAPPFDPVAGTEESHPAGLVLLAMGFLSPEPALLDALGVEKDARGNAKAATYATSADGVFAAGDARRGQSLIVWAINEGRQCARVVDRYLGELPLGDPNAELAVGTSQRVGSPDLGADPPPIASPGV
jgi:glutamate synthase (NADPH) small chain